MGTTVRDDVELMRAWFSGHSKLEIRMAFDQIDTCHSGDLTWDEFGRFAGA